MSYRPEIIERIASAENLPSLPSVAVEVLRLMQQEVSAAQIAAVIQHDPALTLRLLRLVNSSLFGRPRKTSSLQQAVVVLGMRTVKVMVLGFSLVDSMRENRAAGTFDYTGYWRRSLTTAVASRLLAEQTRNGIAEEAFVAGLLCDIGMLAAYHCARDLYEPVLERQACTGEALQTCEFAVLGASHETITAELLTLWGLPQTLCCATRTHHAALRDICCRENCELCFVRVIRAATHISELFCNQDPAGGLEALRQDLVNYLPIADVALQEVLQALDRHVRETASLFSVNVGQTRRYQDIQAEAMTQLTRLSLSAELERAEIAQREQAARRQVEELHDENTRLSRQATTDALTGIANRAMFQERLEQECARASGGRDCLGLLLLDADRFKQLNDTFGHQTGDEVLRQIGECLRSTCGSDALPARYGGEEFAVILPDTTEWRLRQFAEQLRLAIQRLRIPAKKTNLTITISIGGVQMRQAGPNAGPARLVELADRALYAAKAGGRNRVVMHGEAGALAGAPS